MIVGTCTSDTYAVSLIILSTVFAQTLYPVRSPFNTSFMQ